MTEENNYAACVQSCSTYCQMNYNTDMYECVTGYDMWSTFWTIVAIAVIGVGVGMLVWCCIRSQRR